MEERTRELANKLIDQLESEEEDIDVTNFDITEYQRGDPTVGDRDATGAEIKITCYARYGWERDEEDNPFRVK